MLSEMARNPAAPGLLFTAAGVKGFSLLSEVASHAAEHCKVGFRASQTSAGHAINRASVKAEEVGAEIHRQLLQASDSLAVETERSQAALEEWKCLMNGILSQEAGKLQADFDNASARVADWRQQAADFLPSGDNTSHADASAEVSAHPLSLPRLDSLPQFTMPQLESGWLVDAVQQRFPDVGAANAWPTSFSLMSSAESSSASDQDEAQSTTSASSLASHFMQQARQMIEQSADSISQSTAKLEQSASASASSLVEQVREQTSQLTVPRFEQLREQASQVTVPTLEQLREQASQLTVPSFESFSSSLVSSPGQRNGWRSLGTRGQQSREQLSHAAEASTVSDSPQQATDCAHAAVPLTHADQQAAKTAAHAASPARASSPHSSIPTGSQLPAASAANTASPSGQSQSHSGAIQSQPQSGAVQSQSHSGAMHRPAGGSIRGSASSSTVTPSTQTSNAASSPDVSAGSVALQDNSNTHATASSKSSGTPPNTAGLTGQNAASAPVRTGDALPDKPVQASQPVAKSASQPQRKSVTVAKAQGLSASAPVEAGQTLPSAPVKAGQPVHNASDQQSIISKAAGRATTSPASPSAQRTTPFESQRPSAKSAPAAAAKGFASWFGAKDAQKDSIAADLSAGQSAADASASLPQQPAPSTSAASLTSSSTVAATPATPSQLKPSSSDVTAQQAPSQSSIQLPLVNERSAANAKGQPLSAEQAAAAVKPASGTAAAQEGAESSAQLPQRTQAVPKPLQLFKPDSNAAAASPEQMGKQGKSPPQKVRVIRPEPTPNWRTPRPLTPPPGPVQQGHPLSAARPPPASSTNAEPSTSFEADHITGKALGADAGTAEDAQGMLRSSPSGGSARSAVRSPSSSTANSTTPTDYLNSSHTPTTAAATAVDLDAENTVIDSIPWGVTGTATAQGRPAQTQSGGDGGTSGGSTGGSGGGRSGGQPGGSGGKDDADSRRSWWSSLWVPALIAGGSAGAAAASNSSFRQSVQNTFQAIKSRFVTGAEQAASESSSDGGDQGGYNDADAAADLAADDAAQAAANAAAGDDEGGIATNIRIKEGDTAWNLAEEYSGSGANWPQIVSENPDVDMANPSLGATVRIRVRM